MHYCGQVTKRPFATGSKSQRDAFFIVSDEGEYSLRRVGGNPFHDSELERLTGKDIRCNGVLSGTTLFISDWAELTRSYLADDEAEQSKL